MKRIMLFNWIVLAVVFTGPVVMSQDSDDEVVKYEIKKEIESDGSSHVMTITKDGETRVYTWDGEGEMPAEMKSEMGEMEGVMIFEDEADGRTVVVERDVHRRSGPHHRYRKDAWNKSAESPKVRLGIMMDDGDEGVKVTDVFKNTAADEAGLQKGDVILKIDNHYIFTGGSLFKALGNYSAGDEIRILYLREGKEMESTGKLTSRD